MSNDIEVQRVGSDQADALLDLDDLVWAEAGQAPREVRLANAPVRAGFLARRAGEAAGIAGSWDIEVGIPVVDGVELRLVEGLTWVGVHPDHRRRGVLSAMMRHHLEWTRDEQHRALAALKASEPGIYGRFGYATASRVIKASFGRGTSFSAPDAVVTSADAVCFRLETPTPADAERLHTLMRVCAASGAQGAVVRSLDDVRRILADVPELRPNREPKRLLWAVRDGRDVGFALLARTFDWPDGLPSGSLDVMWFGSADAGARLALMRRLTDFDLIGKTVNWVAPDDPLVLWAPTVRGLGGLSDSLWLRVVDLPKAVSERGFAGACDLVVEVRDDLLSDNAGRWRWHVDASGRGTVERTDDPADLSLGITDLAAVWLGGETVAARARAGFVIERTPGATASLSRALATPTGPMAALDF